ncbi:hypothetical protein [Sphingomonas panni]|uniref:hypothetical protein n=1 Tax=Sphingomonas panni TaxID=237612 RepID=UPI001F5BB405|nr:hypothetical protein [Sphingomonas panni]
MVKPLHPVIADITHGLLTAEQSADDAIVSAATMVQSLVADRRQLQLKFGIIQAPLTDAVKAMMLTVEARAHLGRCHKRMHEIGVEHEFFEPTSHGDIFPTTGDPEPIKQSLSLVA